MLSKKIGLIGAGLMGAPMGENWLKKGFELTVLPHKNMEPIKRLVSCGASVSKNLESLVINSDFIILMLPTSREVESVSEKLLPLVQPRHFIIDMTTSEPESTALLFNKFVQKECKFFDAPVTGGVKGAMEGSLTLFIGGPIDYFNASKEVLMAVSKVQKHFGEIGSGHKAKIINNFICIGNLAVFAEALPLASKLGLKPEDILATLQSGTAASKMLDLYGEQIITGDFEPRFKMAHALKDLKIAESIIKKFAVKFPILNAMLEDFHEAKNQGYLDLNISALIRPFENKLQSFFRKSTPPNL